ncbi:MAG: polyisoprenoid-binding protein [Azospira oryzae]|jgi:polyisoprenoid-binding protein YceI|nr:polyisoprenoid-binding protein [Cytophaga sp.]PZR37993.1 MAG: polyisoprenoid-binding protein [Azospira oryzae]
MKKLNLLFAALLLTGATFAQSTWSVDKAHAKLGFTVTHLLVSEVDGAFDKFDSKITSSKDDFSDAVIELTAETASVNTANENRDKHLKSPDFFDVEKFPTLTFKSTSVKKVDAKNYKVTGDLTFHGVTKSVTLDATLNGTTVHPYNKKTIAAFRVGGVIKRSDFAFGAGTPAAVVGDEVTLLAKVEFIKN